MVESSRVRRLEERCDRYKKIILDFIGHEDNLELAYELGKLLHDGKLTINDCRHLSGLTELSDFEKPPLSGNSYLPNLNDYTIRNVPVQPSDQAFGSSPCENCSNNPKNSGSGICNCILGLQQVIY